MKFVLRAVGVLLVTALAAPLTWTLLSRDHYMVVTGTSMEPTYHVGDVLSVQRPQGDELDRSGQIVVVRFAGGTADGERYVHRVVEPTADGAWLQGDNNEVRDPRPVHPDDVVGTPRFAVTGAVAVAFSFTQSVLGRVLLAAGAVAAFLIQPAPSPRAARHVHPSSTPRVRRSRQTNPDGVRA